MSQQGPGGYGGGGYGGPPGGGGYPPGGPPGGGYPPGGPPGGGYPPGGGGAPPGGYGPPGYPPPGGAPPGYGQPQQGYGGYPPGGPPGAPPGGPAGPSKKSKALMWVGLGCGGLLLLSLAGGIASYFYVRSQASAIESAIAAASAGATGTGASPGAVPGTPATLTPTCAKAVACCKANAAKAAGVNAAAVEQACSGIGLFTEDVCAKQYEGYKRAATVLGASCP